MLTVKHTVTILVVEPIKLHFGLISKTLRKIAERVGKG
jgi:hypothetical protein